MITLIMLFSHEKNTEKWPIVWFEKRFLKVYLRSMYLCKNISEIFRVTRRERSVHADGYRPFQTLAYNDAKYYVLFEDDASEYWSIFTMQQKLKVFNKFKKQMWSFWLWYQSVNRREICNAELVKLRRIEHQAIAYNPKQNEKTECNIEMMNEMIRAIIFRRSKI